MNNNRFEFKSSLLLIEIIITVFFFALSGIGCIRLYLKAHDLAQQARQSTGAVVAAQNLAEAYICAEGDLEQAAQLLGEIGAGAETNGVGSDAGGAAGSGEGSLASGSESSASDGSSANSAGTLTIFYDSDWMLIGSDTSGSDAAFCVFLTESVNYQSNNTAGDSASVSTYSSADASTGDSADASTDVSADASGKPELHTARIEVTDFAGNVIYEIPELSVLEGTHAAASADEEGGETP